MVWLKRNILMILGVLVALGLLVGASLYLMAKIKQERELNQQLEMAQRNLQTLNNTQPSLTDENILRVQQEGEWLRGFVEQVRPMLMAPPDANFTDQTFKSEMVNVIAELQDKAAENAVALPSPRYSFTFEAQLPVTRFPSNSIPLLAEQLREIKELCSILIDSQIHAIESLKRVRVYNEEPVGSEHYISNKAISQEGELTITPYEVVFRGFTRELGQVLTRLQSSPIFFSVRAIQTATVPGSQPVVDAEMEQRMLDELGMGNTAPGGARPPRGPRGAPVPAPPPASRVQTVMDETPVLVLLRLDVFKIRPQPAPVAGLDPSMPVDPAANSGMMN